MKKMGNTKKISHSDVYINIFGRIKELENMKVCLVGSSGGHLTHLYMLKPFWKDKEHFWVTFDKEDARSLLEGEKMYPCYYPTNRSLRALIKIRNCMESTS